MLIMRVFDRASNTKRHFLSNTCTRSFSNDLLIKKEKHSLSHDQLRLVHSISIFQKQIILLIDPMTRRFFCSWPINGPLYSVAFPYFPVDVQELKTHTFSGRRNYKQAVTETQKAWSVSSGEPHLMSLWDTKMARQLLVTRSRTYVTRFIRGVRHST